MFYCASKLFRVVSPEDRFESVKHCIVINKILRLKLYIYIYIYIYS